MCHLEDRGLVSLSIRRSRVCKAERRERLTDDLARYWLFLPEESDDSMD